MGEHKHSMWNGGSTLISLHFPADADFQDRWPLNCPQEVLPSIQARVPAQKACPYVQSSCLMHADWHKCRMETLLKCRSMFTVASRPRNCSCHSSHRVQSDPAKGMKLQ